MENSNSNITIVQPNYDSIYSSVVTINQQPIENPASNNNSNVVVIIVDDNNNQATNSESVHQSEPIQSNDSSTSNEHSNCFIIHGDIIKEKSKWWLIDTSNNDLYETGKLDKNGNRSGLSYVYQDDDLVEIHKYQNDRRVDHYIVFTGNKMYEYEDDNSLIYEGGFSKTLFGEYLRSGHGILYEDGVLFFEGEWENDLPNGKGKLYNDDGTVHRRGIWDNGYIKEDSKYIFYKTNRFLNEYFIRFLILSEFIIGIIYMICLLFASIKNEKTLLFLIAILIIMLSITQQYSTIVNTIFCCLLNFISSILVFINDDLTGMFWSIVRCVQIYLIIAMILVIILQHSRPFPSSYEVINHIFGIESN